MSLNKERAASATVGGASYDPPIRPDRTLEVRRFSGAGSSLEHAISKVWSEFGPHPTQCFRVLVFGQSAALRAEICEPLYSIAREALTNALRHSGAVNIEVEVEYSSRRLRVVVRDDGSGIDPRTLNWERGRQLGLLRMREKAESAGAKLKVWSRPGCGTEVEISLCGEFAAGARV
jgi:signal transduction histidine kinase